MHCAAVLCSAASRARYGRLALQLLHDLVDLGTDFRLQILEFGTNADQTGVPIPQLLRQIRKLALDLGFLPGKILNGRRAEHVGRRLRVAGHPDHLPHLLETGFRRCSLGASDDQLAIQTGHLLRDECSVLALKKASAPSVLLDGTIGLRDLLAQVLQLCREPLVGPARRFELRVQLRHDVCVGDGVGDASRFVRGFGCEGDDNRA